MRFVDTSFWFALNHRRDQHHAAALWLWSRNRSQLVTTNHVLGETWTHLNRRGGHVGTLRFMETLWASPRLMVHFVTLELEQEAWSWLRRHDERTYSFVDATSFATMRRLELTEALAFDGDFSAAGFVELRP